MYRHFESSSYKLNLKFLNYIMKKKGSGHC